MGLTLGGPLVKDKLFFFLSYDDFKRVSAPPQANFIPDATQLAAVVARAQAAGGYVAGDLSADNVAFQKTTIAKLDWTLNSNHRAAFRVNGFTNENPFNAAAGGNNAIERGVDFSDKMVSASTQLISTLGTGQLNELRVQYAQRHQTRFAHDPSVTSPTVNIAGGTVNGINNKIGRAHV